MKRAALIAVIFFTIIQPAQADKFYDGLVAYNTGDYATAERLWRPLAEQEVGNAQSGLGLLYFRGQGVGKDYAKAREWFWKAAGHGVVQAQMFLSIIYYYGNGISPDNVLAYMWADLAVTGGHPEAQEFRDFVAQTMSQEQVAQAWRLTTEWRKFNDTDSR